MTSATIYQPSRSLASRVSRRLTPFQSRRLQSICLERPIVSFSFDDCPRSVVENALPLLEARAWPSTIYLACGLFDITNHLGLHMSAADAKAVATSGHELGDHTFSHFDATQCAQDSFLSDIARNQKSFDALGLPKATSFAYPYGQTTPRLKTALGAQFKGLRGITPLAHARQVDLNQIGSFPLFSDSSLDRLLQAILHLEQHPAWLTIFTHDVCDAPSAWGCTQADLTRVIAAVEQVNATVLSVSGAIEYLEKTYD